MRSGRRVRNADSIDKIITIYLASVSRASFVYNGRLFEPKPLVVSPLLLRGFTCPTGCGACCGNFSLDYLPSSDAPVGTTERGIKMNDRYFLIKSDRQFDNSDRWCRHLERSTGRCGIYEQRPLSCDFELIRFLVYADHTMLIQKQYGRAWAMLRLDNERGARCEMLPPDPNTVLEVKRKLLSLQDWADHFEVVTCVSDIISWIESGSCDSALRLDV